VRQRARQCVVSQRGQKRVMKRTVRNRIERKKKQEMMLDM
jgi:hypothetical protein